MVRVQNDAEDESHDSEVSPLFPHYNDKWTYFDPDNESYCEQGSWANIWQNELQRDEMHRSASLYLPHRGLYVQTVKAESRMLEIILFGSVLICLFLPQIMEIIGLLFCHSSSTKRDVVT